MNSDHTNSDIELGAINSDHTNSDVDLPGVHLPEGGEYDEIPGVDTAQEQDLPDPYVDVGVDFDNPAPQELPLVELEPQESTQANDGVRRSTRESIKPVNYKPSMTGQKYSFATTQLGKSFLNDGTYQCDPVVAFAFMQQMSLKAALKQWGDDAEVAGIKETSQLHWRNTFVPKHYAQLTHDEKSKVLESHMFVVKKRTGETKARLVGGGNKQRDYLTKEDSSSPTVATESVLLTSIVDADEGRDIAIIDIPNAFIQTRVEEKKDRVIIRIRGVVVDWLTKIAPEVYNKFVSQDKKGDKTLLVECMNAIYGTMVAGLLYYRKFAQSLERKNFIKNSYDPCVWNKVVKGKQCTICFHVDDCKISHVSPKVIDDMIAWLRQEYESIFTDGSGKMKVARGKVHKYLGMTLDFATSKLVKVKMFDYVDEIIEVWNRACKEFDNGFEFVANRKKIATAAPEDLFKVNEDALKLSPPEAKSFHSIIAMILYVTKRARPDTALAVAFLTTRVKAPDEDDWRKLRHLVEYLKSTRDLPLVLGAFNTGVLHWHVDASFAAHHDMRGHTGGALTMGTGCPVVSSTKQKCNVRSSTVGELVAVDEMLGQILWTRLFMLEQGIKVSDNILYQDNKSAILLETNGRASSSKRTKHIEIRYYYVADHIANGDLSIVWCPTDKMIADFLTKPLQGKVFQKFRDVLMGAVPKWYDID
jgi:hypothetical protein